MTMTNEEAARVAKQIAVRAVADWRVACGELFLDDLSKTAGQIDRFEVIANRTEMLLNALIGSMDEEPYEEAMDAAWWLKEAYKEANQAITWMVEHGLFGDGSEALVFREMSENVLPRLERAASDFDAAF
jgi:hypothetical protein